MFTSEDLKQLQIKGIGMDVVERQLEYFRNGFPFLQLDRAATIGDGIRQLTAEETGTLEQLYEKNAGQRKIYKFVPASGAATRMFKDLFEFLQTGDDRESAAVQEVFARLHNFAFYPDLKEMMDKQDIAASDRKKIVAAILLHDGLNYGSLPKGMLPFHKYGDDARTALEEHMAEGANYTANGDGS